MTFTRLTLPFYVCVALLLLSGAFNHANIVIVGWLALATIGLPCLIVGAALYFARTLWASPISLLLLGRQNAGIILIISLIVLSLQSMLGVAQFFLEQDPQYGPVIGYAMLFYITGAIIWLPILVCWGFYLDHAISREAGIK